MGRAGSLEPAENKPENEYVPGSIRRYILIQYQ
jgi:hypothetical protein